MVLGLEKTVAERSAGLEIQIQGPEEIEYGWGWAPTVTYWVGKRRVHFYWDMTSDHNSGVAEIADTTLIRIVDVREDHPEWTRAKRQICNDVETAWNIIKAFLIENVGFDEMPGKWAEDGLDHDKFIPDPPAQDRPGDIAQLIGAMKAAGARPWKPDSPDDDTKEDEE